MVIPLLVFALFLLWGSDTQVIEADDFKLAPEAPRNPAQPPLSAPSEPTDPAPAP